MSLYHHSFLVLLLFASAFCNSVQGATTHSVTNDQLQSSETTSHSDLNSGLSDNAQYYSLPQNTLDFVLNDNLQLISQEFKISKELRPLVEFWFLIYTQYSSYQQVFFHELNPSIVYTVQDDRELFKRGLSPVAHELNSQLTTKKIRAELKSVFLALSKNPSKKFPKNSLGYAVKHAWRKSKNLDWAKLSTQVKSQRGQRDFVMRGVQSFRPFMSSLENVFSQYSLPTELTRIPLLESSFQINAYSKAAAVGVWQFLKNSGKEYLIIDEKSGIDERLSPVKAAHAAAKMFKRNIRLLGDYSLAVIAYNHGPKNLLKVRRTYGTKNISRLLDPSNQRSPLGFASRNYYAEFLAILHAEKYAEHLYGINSPSTQFVTKLIKIERDLTMYEIAAIHNVNLHDLKRFNPDVFSLNQKLKRGTGVVIPNRFALTQSTLPTSEHGADLKM